MQIILSKIIEREMKNQGLNLTGLAKATSIPKSTLSDWINGRLPSSRNLHQLLRLSNFFKVSLNELLFGKLEDFGKGQVLFSSFFKEGRSKYRIVVEKMDDLK